MARLFVVAAALALAGCASAPPGTPDVSVTSTDRGREMVLTTGQRLVVSLAANPTTGYQWTVTDGAEAVLASVGEHVYTQDAAAPGMVGVGGTDVWTFTATQPGRGTLRLAYGRSFEPGEAPAETFEVPVTVR